MFLYKDGMTLMLTNDGMSVSKAQCEDRIAEDRRTLLVQHVIQGCSSMISGQLAITMLLHMQLLYSPRGRTRRRI